MARKCKSTAYFEKITKTQHEYSIKMQCIFIATHSFIHSGDLCSASSRHYYSEALPAQSQPKKKDFREMYNLEEQAISKERSSMGRSFHADIGPQPKRPFAAQ